MVSVSSSAIGLYIQNTTALLNPSSVKFKTVKMDENKLLSPRNSTPSVWMNTVLTRNGKSMDSILLISPNAAFLIEFLVLLILMIIPYFC